VETAFKTSDTVGFLTTRHDGEFTRQDWLCGKVMEFVKVGSVMLAVIGIPAWPDSFRWWFVDVTQLQLIPEERWWQI